MDKRPFYLIILTILVIVSIIYSEHRKDLRKMAETTEITNKDIIVVGSKPNTEGKILAEMLTLLIEEYTDLKVEQKLGIGPDFLAVHPSLLNGEIDLYPEFTGDAWYNILSEEFQIPNANILYNETKKRYLERFNVEWLDRYGYNSSFGLAMKRSKAEELGILTYSDLALKGSDLVFGAEFDFYDIKEGYTGLVNMYNIKFKDAITLDFKEKYDAIMAGKVDVIPIFTTDGLLEEHDLIILEDDRNYFPIAEPATVIRVDILERYPQLREVLNKLGGKISAEEITRLNYLVDIEKKSTRDVAKMYLQSKGLIK